MNKTLTINAPEGYEVDKDKSTFEKIVFKQLVTNKWSRDELTSYKSNYFYILRHPEYGFQINKNISTTVPLVYTYPTKELAEEEVHIFRTMQLMRHWARFHNELDGFIPDWTNRNQIKWGLELESDILYVHNWFNRNVFIFGISVSSGDRAHQMLKEFGHDLLKIKW